MIATLRQQRAQLDNSLSAMVGVMSLTVLKSRVYTLG